MFHSKPFRVSLALLALAGCAEESDFDELAADAQWIDADAEEWEAIARSTEEAPLLREPRRYAFDTTPPTGSVTINSGATATASESVTLTISATDVDGVAGMCISNTFTCTSWVTYATSVSWTLVASDGSQSVKVWFRDGAGNANTSPYVDSIVVDKTGPGNGFVTPTNGNTQVSLAWSGFGDAWTGVASYRVVWATGTYPVNCSSGTTLYTGTGTSTTHTGLTNGTLYYYRVCGIDGVGNMGTGATAIGRPAPEFTPPTGSISINAGATWSTSTSVTLTITATDPATPIQMCVSNTLTCSSWQALSSPLSWTLSGTGTRTVYLSLRDGWGNATTTPYSDSISVDATPPTNGTFTVTPGNMQNSLAWSGFSDTSSGVASYIVVWSSASTPANCSSGTTLYSGTGTSTTHTGLTNGTTYYYRVCAIDTAGNVSTGTGGSGRPAPEFAGPSGSVTIDGDSPYTGTTDVTLEITATDASTPIQMCISNTSTCTSWQALSSPVSWTLVSGYGNRTVNVRLRDAWGNESTVSDVIFLDEVAPIAGWLSAWPSDMQIDLAWGDFYDGGSGIWSYALMHSNVDWPTTCDPTMAIYVGTDTFFSHTGLVNGEFQFYVVCAFDAVGNAAAAWTWAVAAPESNPPYGTITIDGGAEWTASRAVTISIDVMDDSGVAWMCIGITPFDCLAFLPYSSTLDVNLPPNDGNHTIYMWFADVWNNINFDSISDSIGLDRTGPVGGSVTVSPGNTNVGLSWTGFNDPFSGIAEYRVVVSTTGFPSSQCSTGTEVYRGTGTTTLHTGLVNGTTYYYRVCAIDAVGNASSGIGVTGRPAPEFTAPTGTVSINSGAAWTNSTSVSLSLSATDASGVTHMCLSNVGKCTTWITYATSATWTLSGTGTRTVYATFRDSWGNVSTTAASDSIGVDIAPPVNGTVSVTPGNTTNSLSWSSFSDVGSGITSYTVRSSTTATPSSCATGTLVYSGSATSFTHTMLTNGTTYYYRVCAVDAAGNTSSGATGVGRPAPEFIAPTGSVSVNGGATYAPSTSVSLTLSATDASGVTQMCITNGTLCSSWIAYATSATWTLTAGFGLRTVTVMFRDAWGNTTTVSDSIYLDAVPPYNGTLGATAGNMQVSLSWSGFGDPASGVASYRLVFSTSSTPTNCSGTAEYTGTATSYLHTGLVNGTTYYYRLCAVDAAGNVSSGATASAIAAPESTPPTGTVLIDGGATYTSTSSVTLGINATDATGVASMCISNGTTCTAWQAFSSSPSWTLPSYDGTHTVRVWLRDTWGNTTTSPITDTIVRDALVPIGGTVNVTPGNGEVSLDWSGFTDATSGVAGYTLVRASSMPTSCATGTVLSSGTGTSWTDAGLVNGTTYYYRVCATDGAGNTSNGVGATGRPAPEFLAPIGSVSILDGAVWSTSTTVTLTIDATDDSGVSLMCLSNNLICTTWVPYATAATWTLSGTGTRSVNVWFRDTWNNQSSTAATDSIGVDPFVPASGTMTRTVSVSGDSIQISWSGFTDSGSGIDHYILSFSTTSAPSCGMGTLLYSDSGTSFTHTSLTPGTTYHYRLCAQDVAGNTNTGITGSTSL